MLKKILITIILFSVLIGCRATVKEYSEDDKVMYDASYTYSDLKEISRKMSESITSYIEKTTENKPVLIIYNIANRTSEHIDTLGLADSIRTNIFKTGKVSFLSREQRQSIESELAYQYNSGNVSENSRIEKAKQAGAQFILSGRIMSIEKKQPKQFRLKKKNIIYYKLTLELTDIRTGLLVWTEETEIVRESSKPLIGW